MPAEHRLLTEDIYRSRVERLRARMLDAHVDAVLLSDPASIFYFGRVGGLGTGRPLWLVIPVQGECTLIVPRIELPVAALATWVSDRREWVEWPEQGVAEHWAQPLVAVIRERGVSEGRLGIERDHVTARVLDVLLASIPRANFVDAAPLTAHVRRRKDALELAILRTAGRVAAAELAGARVALSVGVPEYELGLAARAAGTRAAAEAIGPDYHLLSPLIAGVQSIVAAGPDRGAMAHARASTYRIEANDVVQLCLCGSVYLTYNLGFDRPLVVDAQRLASSPKRVLDVALDAHDAALEAIRPGRPASEVHGAAVRVMERAGLLPYRAHRTGRGVGAAGAEAPELRESDHTPLEPGMTFTVEPGIYVPGVGGARFGDTVVVMEDGYEMLTPAPYGWRGR